VLRLFVLSAISGLRRALFMRWNLEVYQLMVQSLILRLSNVTKKRDGTGANESLLQLWGFVREALAS
jgi:hypothetical protein